MTMKDITPQQEAIIRDIDHYIGCTYFTRIDGSEGEAYCDNEKMGKPCYCLSAAESIEAGLSSQGSEAQRVDTLTSTRQQVLRDAEVATSGARQLAYGKPESNFQNIANLWNAYLQGPLPLNPADVALMLTMVKIARLITSSSHYDSWVDIAGYAACGAEVANAKNPEKDKP